ncbi:hypothetical protein BD410DRAFT_757102 [Rickenella mellea]|uniref:BTB domain-containing protein n=1 Tax=Rickenella mellea TaxID=50990 RepID=A0A4Y7PJM4_9AGAM|nr:hypothetical protein BD410DRAFT_757102 [Rickenella mellea]
MSMEERNPGPDLCHSELNVEGEDRNHPYFCTNVVLMVEGRLFQLPRILFEGQSSLFKVMFLLPPPSSNLGNEEGGSVSNPIRLDGIKRAEFESFLRVLFPLDPLILRSHADMTKYDWLSALKLATMWEFDSVRQVAINYLNQLPLGDIERVVILNDFDINEWKVAAYTELVTRSESLSAEDADALGLQLTAKFSAARESFLRAGNTQEPERAARAALRQNFGDEVPPYEPGPPKPHFRRSRRMYG